MNTPCNHEDQYVMEWYDMADNGRWFTYTYCSNCDKELHNV